MIHLPLQQPDRVCPLLPLLHAVVALRMCQPVHGLVGMVIHPAHRLRSCLLLARSQAQTRLGGEPLTLGRRGRHSYGSEWLTRRRSGI